MAKIKSLTIQKSRTIGIQSQDRTRFRKIQIQVQSDLSETDVYTEVYQKLSELIEANFEYEKGIK